MAAAPGSDIKNRLPWIVAACAIVFALVVLVRSELTGERDSSEPVAQAPERPRATATPRPMRTPARTPVPQETAAPTATVPSTDPTAQHPAASPTPSPTPAVYSLSGLVSDPDGKPIPKATVRATYSMNGSQMTATASSDAKGAFKLENIRSTDLDVVIVEAVGFRRSIVEKLKLPIPDQFEFALTPLAGLQIAVERATGEHGERAPFEGEADFVLLQKRSSAATTASLGIAEVNVPLGQYTPVAHQQVNIHAGSFSLEEMEAGDYKAALHTKDAYAESSPFTIAGAARTYTTITLGLKYTFGGTIAAEATGHPIPQARARMRSQGGGSVTGGGFDQFVFADGNGHFRISGVAPGTYTLALGANGFTTKTVDAIEVSQTGPPAETSYTLVQQQPYVRVTVVDGAGKPLPDVRLVLMMTRPTSKTMFSRTDQAGAKTFENVAPGEYTLAATTQQERARQKSVDLSIADGETTEIQIAFPSTTHVQGHARKDGQPYRGLVSFALRGSVDMQTIVKTDEGGGYTAELEPGEYMAGTTEQPNAQVVLVHPNQAGNIDLELK